MHTLIIYQRREFHSLSYIRSLAASVKLKPQQNVSAAVILLSTLNKRANLSTSIIIHHLRALSKWPYGCSHLKISCVRHAVIIDCE